MLLRVQTFGIDVALDRGVFGGQAERVQPHRMHDVEALHADHPRDGVAERVILRMSDVQIARRVRQHLEDVPLLARVVVGGAIEAACLPGGLPMLFDGAKIVRCGRGPFFEHAGQFERGEVRPCHRGDTSRWMLR